MIELNDSDTGSEAEIFTKQGIKGAADFITLQQKRINDLETVVARLSAILEKNNIDPISGAAG